MAKDDDFEFHPFRWFGWVCLGLMGIFLLGMLGSFLGVFGGVVTAPGRVVTKTLDTNNIINNYEYFHDQLARFQSVTEQVKQYKGFYDAAVKANSTNVAELQIDLGAIQQNCRNIANDYNANADKSNRNIFMGRDVPQSLDPSICETN